MSIKQIRQDVTSTVTSFPSLANSLSSVPPLTSIFTPVSDCTIFKIVECDQDICSAYDLDPVTRSSCYPKFGRSIYTYSDGTVFTAGYPELTYSPGIHCPHGMTIALSRPPLDAVYCCYRCVKDVILPLLQ